MQDILKQIALCVEKGKIAREFPHPAELAGQDGVYEPAKKALDAVAEHSPQAVALSALLTTTMVNMEHITRMIKTAQPGVKVVIGGAPVTQSFADRIGADCYSPDPQGALEFLNKHCS